MHRQDPDFSPATLHAALHSMRAAARSLEAMLTARQSNGDTAATRSTAKLFQQVLAATLIVRCHLRVPELADLTAADYQRSPRPGTIRPAALHIGGSKRRATAVTLPADVAALLESWIRFAGIAPGSSTALFAPSPAHAKLSPSARRLHIHRLVSDCTGVSAHVLRGAALLAATPHRRTEQGLSTAPSAITLTITIRWSESGHPRP